MLRTSYTRECVAPIKRRGCAAQAGDSGIGRCGLCRHRKLNWQLRLL